MQLKAIKARPARFLRLVVPLVGLLEDFGLRRGGAVGGDGTGESGLHLRGGEGVPGVGHGVEEGGGSLADESAVPVGPGVGQRVGQAGVAAEDGGTPVAEEIGYGSQGADDGGYGIGVGTPVPEDNGNGDEDGSA
ncbi:hypothetical protein BHM03_00004401 [Ensete ventricosum]|nr:hypothetical protein BHM03_00004401 [Ensete ventricosum]